PRPGRSSRKPCAGWITTRPGPRPHPGPRGSWSPTTTRTCARISAASWARARPPDLVLSDVMMPGLDGFGLLRALRADESTRHVPVVLLSARAGEEARIEGLERGADDYLVKPFSARELVARIGSQL